MSVITATDRTFHELTNTEFCIVDCFGTHCGPCKLLTPIFEDLARDMDHIRFAELNVEENPDVTTEYKIYSIPTLLFFRNGALVNRTVGAMDEDELCGHIAGLLYGMEN